MARGIDPDHATLMFDEDRWGAAAQRMVERQLRARGIADPRTLAAMRSVPRHVFVRPELRSRAYDDTALPTESGQTISQPYIVALMTETLDAHPGHGVLEIGSGSGYQAAVLALLADRVITVERVAELADGARGALRTLGITNAEVVVADGTRGLPERAPFDRILVAAGAAAPPPPLLDQLADGGRLVIPLGDRDQQVLTRIDRSGDAFVQRALIPCRFVPLVGEHGWPE